MRVGITVHNERVSPLFDAARLIEVITLSNGGIENRETLELQVISPQDRADALGSAKIETLICGAVSAPYSQAIQARGIQLLPFHAGEVDDIIKAFINDQLNTRQFSMPGCGRRRRRRGKYFKYRNNF